MRHLMTLGLCSSSTSTTLERYSNLTRATQTSILLPSGSLTCQWDVTTAVQCGHPDENISYTTRTISSFASLPEEQRLHEKQDKQRAMGNQDWCV
ncbi:hypothetical protein BU24DRAFT_418692 [Aaosphaeria arxii CBS 175.79]|uniref:Uncharacterized protein n=1 Tax=Aaosphaeria arxii CBS 175.79 TaxID=1450172 RepID=A0A6A5Y2R0_9PLEO|nr:uncharacterized protein BU24DRAFT_418692 [Aaosphaeria arxii CBS 175.79]KAF2019090.1 hypothetical protein BU24DRAFT_418692 [Aaosphaeria arxii CBS 175.79]